MDDLLQNMPPDIASAFRVMRAYAWQLHRDLEQAQRRIEVLERQIGHTESSNQPPFLGDDDSGMGYGRWSRN